MKTIAVLTDLSENSFQSAMYALHLAKKIEAKVILYNSCVLVPKGDLVISSEYSFEDDQDVQTDAFDNLALFSSKLQDQLQAKSAPGSFLPAITFDSSSNEIVDIMTSIVSRDDIILIVTATSLGKDVASFVQSDSSREIIDWTTVPVLIVPDFVDIRNPEKVAFVSKLALADADHIKSLTGILEPFATEIMVSYLHDKDEAFDSTDDLKNSLLAHIVSGADYGRIYYRKIFYSRHLAGWQWLKDHKKCDILVLSPQSPGELNEFLCSGNSPQITWHVPIPVMILPALR